MPKRIYVGNLPPGATQNDVRALVSRHGVVESVQIVNDRATGRLSGIVEMSSGADEAIAALNHTQMGGRSLNVRGA